MLTPEQRKTWQRLDSLTNGLMELLELVIQSQNISSEVSDIARCHLLVVHEVREAMLDLCPAEEMYDGDQEGAA